MRRFGADDVQILTQSFGDDGAARNESATTDRRHEDVQFWRLIEKFEGCRALAGNDAIIVVGMNERGTRFPDDAFTRGVSRFERRRAESEFRAIAAHGVDLVWQRILGHNDMDQRADDASSIGQRSSVVS
ncbi:MAG: hypothetical protein ACI8T1_001797 [Verrucomicrobiales bacterium]|jgi:hypothetical protein